MKRAQHQCSGSWNEVFWGKGVFLCEAFQSIPVSPVNALVVIRAVEELNLFKGAGAREAASHSWVQAQEEVDSCGP